MIAIKWSNFIWSRKQNKIEIETTRGAGGQEQFQFGPKDI